MSHRKRFRTHESLLHIAELLGDERKFFDTDLANQSITASWATVPTGVPLNLPTQGDGASNRDGISYVVDALEIRGRLSLDTLESQTAPQPDWLVRVAVYIDTQCNGTAVTPGDPFQVTGGLAFDAFQELETQGRFVFLHDKVHRVPGAQATTNEGAANLFSLGSVKVPVLLNLQFKRPVTVSCSGNAGTVADIVSNAFYLSVVSTASSGLKFDGQARIRFRG